MLERWSNLNMCDVSRVMVSMDRQNKYSSDVVMCDGKIEWLTQFLVRNIGTKILSHEPHIQMVCQSKYFFTW